jgi:RNA polymerase sigma-70 factor, ECF subfamily
VVVRLDARAAVVSDRVLVLAAQDGDLDAFGELVERHRAGVYRLAFRMLGSSADAEDAGQEAFLRAWRAIGRFRAEASFRNWLFRIVTNQCLTVLAGRRPTEEVPERFEAVARAIAQLPHDQRVALVLRDFQGLSYEEISDVLDLNVGTVSSRITRARLSVVRTVGDL